MNGTDAIEISLLPILCSIIYYSHIHLQYFTFCFFQLPALIRHLKILM